MKNLNQIKLYCLDMDGTIYLDDVLIPNVIETLNFLREKARIVFLTNNSSKSKDAYIEKLNKLGIKVTNNEIYTSGMATCEFIKEKFNNKKVYLVGTEALIKEFNDYKIPLDDINPDIVVLSYDTSLNYQKLVKLTNFIHQGKIFIATHPDINCPALPYYVPDIGSFLALIEKNYHEIKFNKNIGFMNTVIYIYRCVPVLSAIEEVTSADTCFISRKEINEFINRFNVDFKFNDDFKLSDHSTCKF